MSHIIRFTLLAVAMATFLTADGKQFPKPNITIQQAIKYSQTYLIKSKTAIATDPRHLVVTCVKYSDKFQLKLEYPQTSNHTLDLIPFTHFWVITYSLPASSDVSITLVALPSGKVIKINETV